jgi:hypothetical protein
LVTANFSHVHGITAQRYNSHSEYISVYTKTIRMMTQAYFGAATHISQCSAAVNIKFSAYIYKWNMAK